MGYKRLGGGGGKLGFVSIGTVSSKVIRRTKLSYLVDNMV
jgi:hypothetical protein